MVADRAAVREGPNRKTPKGESSGGKLNGNEKEGKKEEALSKPVVSFPRASTHSVPASEPRAWRLLLFEVGSDGKW
jgi:hypothetical protein